MDSDINEYGDKVGRKEIYQGLAILISLAGFAMGFCLRGCAEVKKRVNKVPEKAKIIYQQQQHVK